MKCPQKGCGLAKKQKLVGLYTNKDFKSKNALNLNGNSEQSAVENYSHYFRLFHKMTQKLAISQKSHL